MSYYTSLIFDTYRLHMIYEKNVYLEKSFMQLMCSYDVQYLIQDVESYIAK